jgi:microcystin-dependent protein
VSKLNFQYDLQNLTPANALPVEANFTKVEQHINQELIERDGSVGMRAQLKLVGDPVAALDAAPKQYVDQVIPVGLIMMWGAATAPANGKWLLCDGAPIETALYPELFAVIGYAWGGSGGSFNTPNMGGRMPVGVNGAHALGQKAGSEDSSLPAHSHDASHGHGASAGNDSPDHAHGSDHYHNLSGSTGGGGAHQHVPSPPGENFITNGAGGVGADIMTGGGGYMFDTLTNVAGDHTHTVSGNTNYMSQVAGQSTATAGANARHSHGVTVNGFSGRTDQQGVAPAGTNMPPFLAVPFIIRCK